MFIRNKAGQNLPQGLPLDLRQRGFTFLQTSDGRGEECVWRQDVHHVGRGNREKQNCFPKLRKISFTMSRAVQATSLLPSPKRGKENV